MPVFEGVCVKCGKCKSVCPTYDLIKEENFSPRGRVHLSELVEKGSIDARKIKEPIESCLMCMACEKICPQFVPITEMIKRTRAFLHDAKKRAVSGFVNMHERRAAPSTKLGSSFKVCAIFVGCLVGEAFPDWLDPLARFLVRLGYRVEVPEGQVCCGFPFEARGDFPSALERKRLNDRVFAKYDAIITLCSTCASHLKKAYGWSDRVLDFVEVLNEYADLVDFRIESGALFHIPCHLHRGQEVLVDGLLKRAGLEAMSPVCCGFGGKGRVSYDVGSLRIREAVGRGASVVYTSCPACVLQLVRVSKALGAGIKIAHILEATC